MNFALNIVDEVCKIREKYNCPKFIIGYRLSPEEPYEDGLMTDEEREYLKVRATDIGLYILGCSVISKEGMYPNLSLAMSEKDIPALKERADIIKSQRAKAIMQMQIRESFWGSCKTLIRIICSRSFF